jgi:hybrid cluster-associated redox disulfide protein
MEKNMGKVTKDMSIIDIVQQFPESLEVFAKYGLGCIGCAAARFENLEAGAKVHGIDPDVMVAEINALIEKN